MRFITIAIFALLSMISSGYAEEPRLNTDINSLRKILTTDEFRTFSDLLENCVKDYVKDRRLPEIESGDLDYEMALSACAWRVPMFLTKEDKIYATFFLFGSHQKILNQEITFSLLCPNNRSESNIMPVYLLLDPGVGPQIQSDDVIYFRTGNLSTFNKKVLVSPDGKKFKVHEMSLRDLAHKTKLAGNGGQFMVQLQGLPIKFEIENNAMRLAMQILDNHCPTGEWPKE